LVLVPGREVVHAVALSPIVDHTRLVRRWKPSTPWIVVGVGAGALAIGGVLEVLAHSEIQTYDDLFAAQCPAGCGPTMPPGMQSVDSRTQRHQTIGKIENVAGVSLLVIGGAAALGGLIGVYLNAPHSMIEHVTPTGNGAAVSWTF